MISNKNLKVRGSRWAFSILLLFSAGTLQGCGLTHPRVWGDAYIRQPHWDGTFDGANKALGDVASDLEKHREYSTDVDDLTKYGTLVGLGGAGVGAIFHASRDLVLGFATGGATSFAINGVSGVGGQVKIYEEGLAAVACLGDAVAPTTTAMNAIHSAIARAIRVMAEVNRLAKRNPGDAPAASTPLILAEGTLEAAYGFETKVDTKVAPQLIQGVRQVVTEVNDQISTTIPDAAAFARAGAGLQSIALGSVSPPITPQSPTQGRHLRATTSSPEMTALLQNLHTATANLADLLTTPVTNPKINCKVATVTASAPIAIIIPGGQGKIELSQGTAAAYEISGGTPPYLGPQWSPTQPACFTSLIESPNILRFAPTTQPCKKGQPTTYLLDIYDSMGHHLRTMMTVSVKPK